MRSTVKLNNPLYSENENMELFACFPWSARDKRNHRISNSNKNLLLGICFITDMDGYFKYIHPNFLALFDGVENQFFESSILAKKDSSIESPAILKYLVAMIQKNSPYPFLKNRFSNCTNKLQWNMVYNKGLLYFSLDEEPIAPIQEESTKKTEASPKQMLYKEIKKIYWKIEHAKMFHTNQISKKTITE